jgi:AraC-like DNA-binding protein
LVTNVSITAVSHRTSSARDVARRMRQVVEEVLAEGGGSPDIRLVADTLQTSVRTLQRRLCAAGVTYAVVVQQARCAAARALLSKPGRPIGEIARTLGYSDHAHFTRAFHRWTGIAPREYRGRTRRTEGEARTSRHA